RYSETTPLSVIFFVSSYPAMLWCAEPTTPSATNTTIAIMQVASDRIRSLLYRLRQFYGTTATASITIFHAAFGRLSTAIVVRADLWGCSEVLKEVAYACCHALRSNFPSRLGTYARIKTTSLKPVPALARSLRSDSSAESAWTFISPSTAG